MRKRSSLALRVPLAAVTICLLSTVAPQPAHARDQEFGMLVHYVESHYHTYREYRFLLGFASLAVNVVRPYGVKGMKIALWENNKIAEAQDHMDFAAVVHAGLEQGWQPMVRAWSRRDGEHVVVFAKPAGNDVKLLVATVDKEEAVVVQLKIDPEKLSKCIEQWGQEDGHKHHGRTNDEKPWTPPPPNDGDAKVAENR